MKSGLLLCALLISLPSQGAAWDSAKEVIHGSSRVLEKGETIVGVISPLAYGLHDRATVFTHPALHLLLTPNFWGRLALLEGTAGVSLESGYQQSFLSLSGTSEDHYPGFFQLGAVYSQLLTANLQLNCAAGYLVDIDTGEETEAGYRTGFYYRVGTNIVIKRRNLLIAQVRGKVMSGPEPSIPTGTVLFARQLGRMRVGVGASVGEFVIRTGYEEDEKKADEERAEETAGNTTEQTARKTTEKTINIYPYFDLWWRF